jgi:hypothetical protein
LPVLETYVIISDGIFVHSEWANLVPLGISAVALSIANIALSYVFKSELEDQVIP